MKPNDFILNSDYLSLSTATTFEQTITFSGGSIPAGYTPTPYVIQTINITAPKVDQAEFQYTISPDGQKWYPAGTFEFEYNSTITGQISVFRTGSTTVQAYLVAYEDNFDGGSFPAKQFWIKEAAIIAPDMK